VTDSRVARGRKTQVIAADYLKPVFPDAESRAASLGGTDILNTPGWALEVKGRREFKPTEWSKQMVKNTNRDFDWSACIMRPDGYGEAKVGQWVTFMLFEDFRALIGCMQRLEREVERLESENLGLLFPLLSDQPDP
jgi:hypothetical protein